MSSRKRVRKTRNARSSAPVELPPQSSDSPAHEDNSTQLAAVYASCLNLLLAALADDGRLDAEFERTRRVGGPKVVAAAFGFLAGDAALYRINLHGSREAAIDAVTAELAEVMLAIGGGTS